MEQTELNLKIINVSGQGKKISIINELNQEVGRAFLYILKNELHKEPFGLMEDVFVSENVRGKGIGTMLVNELISQAKKANCYKLICTSRFEKESVHNLYEKIGFKKQGYEFRINFD